VLGHAAFEVCRTADVESSVGAEKHVCVSHVLIMSGTTDSPGGRACRDLCSTWVVSTGSPTGHRACRDDPDVRAVVSPGTITGSSWLCVSRETVCV
jgi:hypothetical protein